VYVSAGADSSFELSEENIRNKRIRIMIPKAAKIKV